MYNGATQEFNDAVNAHRKQHVWGILNLKSGDPVSIRDKIIGSPTIETQITEDSDVFNISCLYIGTLDIQLELDIGELDLVGAEIAMYAGVDGAAPTIPMGVFDISDAQKLSDHVLKVTGYDRIARLDAPLIDRYPGERKDLSDILGDIRECAGVTFAQTPHELYELNPELNEGSLHVFDYAENCRKQLQYLAQILGCYVIANRIGYIEFRRYQYSSTALTIPAEQRHSAKISQYKFGVASFSYTDKFGQTYTLGNRQHDTSSVIVIPQENNFIHDRSGGNYQIYYNYYLRWLGIEFAYLEWNPGSIEYYGNPALDVGDMVELTGGVNGENSVNFLICHITWRFRGPQTLISGGAPRAGNIVTSSASGGSSYSGAAVFTSKNIMLAEMKEYKGQLFGDIPRKAAECRFSVTEQTAVFVTCNMTFSGTANARVFLNGNSLDITPFGTGFLSFTLPVMASGGTHELRVMLSGNGELSEVFSHVWGQEIEAKQITVDETDWEYNIENNTSIITGYTGSAEVLEVPEKLGGKTVVKIAEESVADNSDVLAVYIPDGVEAIE